MFARVITALIRRPRRSQQVAGAEAWSVQIDQARRMVSDGDLPQAQAMLERVVRAGSASAEVHHLLGSVYGASGDLERARAQLERALELEPDHAAALGDLGNVSRLSGRAADAEGYYCRAVESDPFNRTYRMNLALLRGQTGRVAQAMDDLQALTEYPAFPGAVRALVDLLDRDGRTDDAKAVCTALVGREPDHPEAHAVLGFLRLKRDLDPRQALRHFERAIAGGYTSEDLWSNRGIALQDTGQIDAAIASYDTALAIRPDYELARFHRSLALLMRGDFERGWPDYELRQLSEDRPAPPRAFPPWKGEALDNAALFVYGEQGIGDEIMFASCLPDLIRRQPRVVLACNAKLETIFRRSFPNVLVMSLERARTRDADPDFAAVGAMTAIGSLPSRFRASGASFPRHDGYLRADPRLVEEYRDRLARLPPGPKVGVSWRGGSRLTRQSLRSLGPDELRTILSAPHVQFIDLQHDSTGAEEGVDDLIAQGRLVHWRDALAEYDRTAALIASLDLVVSVCTAVIHLGGALGRPVLVMAPYSPEWRYGYTGSSMPWYPSVQVERQPGPGDWTAVIRAVHARLACLEG